MPALVERPARRPGDAVLGEVLQRGWSARSPARRVLVADPCADTVESTAWLLRLWGHGVRGAGSGPEALEAALAYRPDVPLWG